MNSSNGIAPTVSLTPEHVAIIMDGNGRWARKRMLPRIEGHRAGAKTVRKIVEESRRLGIRYLTLFAFSTENWERPKEEVGSLMKLFARYLESELELMQNNDIRLRAIGDLDRLPAEVQERLQRAFSATENNASMDLVLAVSYGGRAELVHAMRSLGKEIQQGSIDPDKITAQSISGRLYAPDIPDPELLIRTSNENRISNFLLWQLAYSEIVVSPLFWPEFTIEEFHRCLSEFGSRERRFGLTGEQCETARQNDVDKSLAAG